MNITTDIERASAEKSGRARIVREARALFTAQGFASVSMQQIADAAVVNKATLYHHFRDKEALFLSVMAEEFARMSQVVATAVNAGETLREQLLNVATAVLTEGQLDFGRLAAEMRTHVSEVKRANLMDRFPPPWSHLRIAVDEARRSGQVRDIDAELVARTFFAMLGSHIWWSKTGNRQCEPAPDVAVTIVDLLLDGIRAAPGAVSTEIDR